MKDKSIGTAGAIGIIILIAIVGFSGYTYYQERKALNNIETEVVGPGVPDIGLTSISIPIEMKFHNTSNSNSPPFSVNYDIYVNGQDIGNGSIPQTTVPAGETKTVNQTITVEYSDLGSGLVDSLKSGNFEVTVKGKLNAKMLFGQIPVSQSFETSFSS